MTRADNEALVRGIFDVFVQKRGFDRPGTLIRFIEQRGKHAPPRRRVRLREFQRLLQSYQAIRFRFGQKFRRSRRAGG